MFVGGGSHPLSILLGALGSIVSLLAAAVGFAVAVGLLILLVRFLWFGTRAAQLYLVKNGDSARFSWPVKPVGDEPGPTDGPMAPDASTAPPATPPSPEGEPRAPRKPKSPPTS